MRTLLTRADNEIKGVFSEAEWSFLADSMNGIIIDESLRYSASNLAFHNEDVQTYDRTGDKWGINIAKLNEKVMKLTSAQVDAVYRRIERFWKESPDLKIWAKY